MARLLVSPAASADLDELIKTHDLPPNTRERVRENLRYLTVFPRMGKALGHEPYLGCRYIQGPWRWFLIVYSYDEDENLVEVASFEDASIQQLRYLAGVLTLFGSL